MSAQNEPTSALLQPPQAEQLFKRSIELMEAGGAALPDLQLATAPLIAQTKNTLVTLQRLPNNGPATAHFVRETRAFLAIADATAKPANFPETARKQMGELRDDFARLEAHFEALIADKERLARNPDPSNVKRYAEENSRVSPPGVSARVVFFGDSITDDWRLNEYFTGRDFLNRGIGGQVTSEMLGRMQPDVINLHPRAVLILGGTNDISRGTPLDVIENNLVTMSDLAHLHNIKVLIASVLPVSDYHQKESPRFEVTRTRPPQTINQLNSWIQGFCQKSGDIYVDYATKMRDSASMLPADLADDGLHPNSKGYRVMAPIALQAIDRALGVAAAERKEPPPRRRVHLF